MTATPHVLMVVTSNSKLADTGRSTGLWVEELAAPYQVFQKEGFTIDIASPKGGRPPFDELSLAGDYVTPAVRAFLDDPDIPGRLEKIERLEDVAGRFYDGVFVVGGFGVMWDLVGDPHLLSLLACTAEAGQCRWLGPDQEIEAGIDFSPYNRLDTERVLETKTKSDHESVGEG